MWFLTALLESTPQADEPTPYPGCYEVTSSLAMTETELSELSVGGSTTGALPLASIEVYDPASNAWTVFSATLGQAVTQVSCAALNGTHLVVAGGERLGTTHGCMVIPGCA